MGVYVTQKATTPRAVKGRDLKIKAEKAARKKKPKIYDAIAEHKKKKRYDTIKSSIENPSKGDKLKAKGIRKHKR